MSAAEFLRSSPPPLRVYDAVELSPILKCTPAWLKEKARRREIPFTLLSGSYRWTDAQVEEIVALFTVNPALERPAASRHTSQAPGNAVPVLRARPPRRARRLDGGGNAVA